MSDLGWRAEGIQRALACGGVELELYVRPGFVSQKAVRRSVVSGDGVGITVDGPTDGDPTPDEHTMRIRRLSR